jgi:K+-sensing histidine kinase KdpD
MVKKIAPLLFHYGVAVGAAALATLFTLLLWPFIQTSFFPLFSLAVLVSAWVGGLGPGLLTTALAGLMNAYFFLLPFYSLAVAVDGLLKIGVFTLVAVLISVLTDRRKQAEEAERAQREYFEVTLASIGDAVIVTDAQGAVTFLNRVA